MCHPLACACFGDDRWASDVVVEADLPRPHNSDNSKLLVSLWASGKSDRPIEKLDEESLLIPDSAKLLGGSSTSDEAVCPRLDNLVDSLDDNLEAARRAPHARMAPRSPTSMLERAVPHRCATFPVFSFSPSSIQISYT